MFLFDCLFFALKAVAYHVTVLAYHMILHVLVTCYYTCSHMVLKSPRACFSSVEDVRSIPTILRENRRL